MKNNKLFKIMIGLVSAIVVVGVVYFGVSYFNGEDNQKKTNNQVTEKNESKNEDKSNNKEESSNKNEDKKDDNNSTNQESQGNQQQSGSQSKQSSNNNAKNVITSPSHGSSSSNASSGVIKSQEYGGKKISGNEGLGTTGKVFKSQKEAMELLGTDTDPLCSVSVLPLRFLGKTWMEGMRWLEAVFCKVAQRRDMQCALPTEYLKKVRRIQSINPFYASNLPSGYADELINSSNDWMFPRIQKATERMIDLAGRFRNDQGLKERMLNMAARELLLAQSTDWPLMADAQISADYAAAECEEHLAAFTDVYDSLGSGSIGTDRLIKREKEYPIFSDMNYRFFIS